jgi:hypothetical protein
MEPALVQTAKNNGGDYVDEMDLAFGSNVTDGSTLVVIVGSLNEATVTIEDTQGNTYEKVIDQSVGADSVRLVVFVAKDAAPGATTITVMNGVGVTYADTCVIAREYSGLDATDPVDVSDFAINTGFLNEHSSTVASTPSAANNLVIGAIVASDRAPTYAAGGGYGNLTDQQGFDAYASVAAEDQYITDGAGRAAEFSTTGFVQSVTAVIFLKSADQTEESPGESPGEPLLTAAQAGFFML